MSTNAQYDVIIIGSGAGGGTLARQLAPTGKRILILERGGWLPREVENWSAEEVFVQNRYVPTETWYDKDGRPFRPGQQCPRTLACAELRGGRGRVPRDDLGASRAPDDVVRDRAGTEVEFGDRQSADRRARRKTLGTVPETPP